MVIVCAVLSFDNRRTTARASHLGLTGQRVQQPNRTSCWSRKSLRIAIQALRPIWLATRKRDRQASVAYRTNAGARASTRHEGGWAGGGGA